MTPSSATNYPNDTLPAATGAWKALGPATETTTAVAVSDGSALVTAASGRFGFTGTNSQSGATFESPPSTVTLAPQSRLLRVGGDNPLVDGDEASDEYGNKVSASSTATWLAD